MGREQERLIGYSIVVAVVVAWTVAIIVLAACTAALVPSGTPGCPNRTIWSDSAQRCIPKVPT